MSEPKLVAIINSFNRLQLLEKGLPALVDALKDFGPAAIVVFDAGSTDGTLAWLDAFDPGLIKMSVITAEAGQDSSFSAGVNAACAYAENRYPQCKWFLFYETDNWIGSAEPLKLAVELLTQRQELGGVGFTVHKHNGQPAGIGCPFPTVVQFLLGQQLTHWLKLDNPRLESAGEVEATKWYLCDVVYTSPLVVRRAAWENSQGMDSDAFPFSDCDIDWAWRMRELGWRQAVLEARGVVHDNLESLSSWSAQRTLLFHRSRMRLLCRHQGDWVRLLWPILMIRHLLEMLAACILQLFGYPREAVRKRWQLLRAAPSGYDSSFRKSESGTDVGA